MPNLKNLSKVYPRSKAYTLNRISLNLESSHPTALIGPNGAGKTTLLNILTGLARPTHGAVEWEGAEKNTNNIHFGYMCEDPTFAMYLSGIENLTLFGDMLGGVTLSEIVKLLEQVGLPEHATRKVREYSHGMRQRLALARALLGEPQLLILDEPTNGLDPEGIIQMRDIIQRLITNTSTTVLLASHLLTEIEKLCERIIILRKGSVIFDDTKEHLPGESSLVIKQSNNILDLSQGFFHRGQWCVKKTA